MCLIGKNTKIDRWGEIGIVDHSITVTYGGGEEFLVDR